MNIRLLDKLVGENNGRSDYVKPKEPIERKISSLYNKIKNPVMTNLAVRIKDVRIRDMYPRKLNDLFEGDQIVIAGRYDTRDVDDLPSRESGVYHTQLLVTGNYEGKERTFEYPVEIRPGRNRRGFDFVEKIWAVRRVGFLMDQVQLHGETKEVLDELVRLSKQYGIMTPYTSFLADEGTALHRPRDVRRRAEESLSRLRENVSGDRGQMAAKTRQMMNEADKAPPSSYAPGDVAAAEEEARGKGGGRKALADAAKKASASTVYGNASKDDYEAGRKEKLSGMRQVGNQGIYNRLGNVWIVANATDLDLDKDKEKIQDIERFTEAYFELTRANTKAENEIMASQRSSEELVIRLRSQVYRIR